MSLRHLRVLLWIGLYLVALEVALEVRAYRRGWDVLLMGGGARRAESADERYGPKDGFPFRSLYVERERPEGTKRIWLASSSYAEDRLVEAPVLFPNRAAEGLREAGVPCEMLNASQGGFDVLSNVRELDEIAPDWEPDVSVLYQMSNDIDRISQGLLAPGGTGEGSPQLAGGDTEAKTDPRSIASLVEHTTTFGHLKTQITARVAKGRVLTDWLPDSSEILFEGRLRAFLDACVRVGAQPVLCTFATSHTEETLAALPTEYELSLLRFNPYLSMRGWLSSVERFNDVVRRVAGETRTPLIDFAEALSGRSEHFRDFWHFRDSGHARAGRVLADGLRAAVREEPGDG